jgi:predicted porin
MQKKLLTLAVASALAMPAVALAQVTVFGTIDTGLRNQTKAIVGVDDGSVLTMTDGLRTTNRWGIRGSEDLGGGLMANFWLEGQYSSDTGAGPGGLAGTVDATSTSTAAAVAVSGGLFARKSVVGLSKGGNSVDLGRDYTVNFKSQGIYDPMSYTYTGITPTAATNVAGTRSSNMVTAGFRFGPGGIRVDYALGEVVDESFGTRVGIMGDFAFGPVTITGAFSTQDNAAAVTGATAGAAGDVDTETMNFGGAYRMGAFTFRAGWSNTNVDNGAGGETDSPMIVVGAQYAISPTLNGRVGYYDTKFETNGTETANRKVVIVAMDYILSKRTIAYFAFDRTAIDGTPTAAQSSVLGVASRDGATGLSAGIAHTF